MSVDRGEDERRWAGWVVATQAGDEAAYRRLLRRERLIDALARDLEPVTRPLQPLPAAQVWWLGSWTFVIAITLAPGPMRPGFET